MPAEETPVITEEDAKRIAKQTIHEMLVTLGVNSNEADAILDMQADFRYIRRLRLATEAVPRITFTAAMTAIATGIVGVLVVAFGWRHY
jgi:hypothetical protein